MKRRGFLQMLFGAPAVAVAAPVLAKVSEFPSGLVESEPVKEAIPPLADIDPADDSGYIADFYCSVVAEPVDFGKFLKR